MKYLLSIILILVLTNCGGGGGNNSSSLGTNSVTQRVMELNKLYQLKDNEEIVETNPPAKIEMLVDHKTAQKQYRLLSGGAKIVEK